MGISQIGVSSTVINTSLPPRLTFANRYVWSTTSGSTAQGAMTYRSADNSLYKLDNNDTASQTFQKWSLSSNSATSLTRIQGTSNASPLSRPQLVTGYDGDIYCNVNTANTTTYNMVIHKYSVSGNSWSDIGATGYTWSQSIALLPSIPSHFSNSTDTLIVRGNMGSSAANAMYVTNVNGANTESGSFNYDSSSNQIVGATHCDYLELRDGHDKNPIALLVVDNPWLSANPAMQRFAIGTINYGRTSTNPRTSGFARLVWQTIEPAQFNSANLIKRIHYGGSSDAFQKAICIESRYILFAGESGWTTYDIYTGAIASSPKMHVPTGTNPVYISATKKLYFHATDNYLYEYNVTFGS